MADADSQPSGPPSPAGAAGSAGDDQMVGEPEQDPADHRRSAGTDADLLRALHDEHASALWAFVLHLTGGDRAKAEDVVQETLIRAWRRPSVLAQQDASARGWLFTVARNIVVDDWRAGRRRPTTSSDVLPELLEPDRTETALQSILVAEALRRLSIDHRMVLLECYFRGCTAGQAARILDIPIGTVKSRLHYALQGLRLALEEMGVVM